MLADSSHMIRTHETLIEGVGMSKCVWTALLFFALVMSGNSILTMEAQANVRPEPRVSPSSAPNAYSLIGSISLPSGFVSSLATTPDDTVYVAGQSGNYIGIINPLRTSGGLDNQLVANFPVAVATDSSSNLYALLYQDRQIQIFGPNYSPIMPPISFGPAYHSEVTVRSPGNFAASGSSQAVRFFRNFASYSTVATSSNTELGAFDRLGRYFTGFNGVGAVVRINAESTAVDNTIGVQGSRIIATVINSDDTKFAAAYDPSGFVNVISDSDTLAYSVPVGSYPTSLALTPSGDLLVTNLASNSLSLISRNEQTATTILTGLDSPRGLTVTSTGLAYFADGNGARVRVAARVGAAAPSLAAPGRTASIAVTGLAAGVTMDDATVKAVWWGDDTVAFTRTPGTNAVSVTVPQFTGTVPLTVEVNGTQAVTAGSVTAKEQWYVAQSGTASLGSGASCAAPDSVGSDDTAIRTVLNAMNSDDTVTICNGTYNITGTLTVDDTATIRGQATQSAILDGGNSTQIIRVKDDTFVDPVTLTLTDLTLRNGNTGSNGTDACNDLSQCGGAIYVERQSSLTVARSQFEDNRASFVGGAIANFASGLDFLGGRIHIDTSTFVDNQAGFDGGAINVSSATTATITNSTFVDNAALGRSGGAISTPSSGGSAITSSTFVDNTASFEGEAFYGQATVRGSIFASVVPGDTCKLTGGGAFDASSVVTGTGCANATSVTYPSLNLLGLGDWSGPTPTVWIGPGSSAYHANGGTCPALDQRGATRSAPPCDAGAYERRGPVNEATGGSLDYPASIRINETATPTSVPTYAGGGRTTAFRSVTPTLCSVNAVSGLLTPNTIGDCFAQWYLAPTTSADGAAIDDTVTVRRLAQAPLTIVAPAYLSADDTATLSTTGGSTGGAVAFGASPASACSLTGVVLRKIGSGACTVTAQMAGNATYEPVDATPVVMTNPPPPFVPSPPGPPSAVTAIPGNASAIVSWAPPTVTGTFPIDVYMVRTQPGGQSCTTSTTTCTVTGLTNGTAYTFTVTASSAAGTGPASAPSAPVTPRTIPGSPAAVAATPGDARAIITWSVPADDGGSPITGYRVTTIPTSDGCTVTATTCTLEGLANGRQYVVSIVAVNEAGNSAPATVTVTPRGKASIVISGTRSRNDPGLVKVLGTVTNLDAATVQPYVRLGRTREFQPSLTQATVGDEGRFRWQRATSKRITVYVEAGDIASNRVTIPAR